jgi:amino acid permease
MAFDRVKNLDAILATAEKKSLHRSLGWFQLTLFGIGCVIGTGIFVLTAAGAQKAGPGLMLAFVIAGLICIVAALCYAEIASMAPVAGIGLHLHLRGHGRDTRLDGRLGAGARVRRGGLGGVGGLVRLLHGTI